jgi:hypothetical protein
MMPHAVVVVPVHRPAPDVYETVSLRQCARVFAHRRVVLVAPEGLDLDRYHAIFDRATEERVEPFWMASRQAYNRLMISPELFSRFSRYSHLLLHEPDAIVIEDALDDWAARSWDYIGAPWFKGFGRAERDAPLVGVGNSGLSLHRVSAASRALQSRRRWYPATAIAKDLVRGLQRDPKRLTKALHALQGGATVQGAWRISEMNCDRFWGELVPALCPEYRPADVSDALRFSWETLPARCDELAGVDHPFGMHAWWKHDLPFATTLLERHGVDLSGLPAADRAAGRRLDAH